MIIISQIIQIKIVFKMGHQLMQVRFIIKKVFKCLRFWICKCQQFSFSQTQMDLSRSINWSSNQKKTTYFEKYRRELERISEQMKKDSYSMSAATIASPTGKQKTQFVTVREIGQQLKLPTFVQSDSPQAKKLINKPKIAMKKDFEMASSLIIEPKQDLQYTSKQAQVLKEVQVLIQQSENLKNLIQKTEAQIEAKKKIMNEIKKNFTGVVTEKQYMDNVVTYASRILNIQQNMKIKKETHEQQLGKLVAEKDQIHAENVQLSKQIQQCQEEAEKIEKQSQALQLHSPFKILETKANKLRLQISKLQQDYEQMIEGVNRNEQIKQMGNREYKKYVQIFTKKLVGREVALAEDRIKMRNQNQKQNMELERKRTKLKEKKVELMIRKRSINDASRLISNLQIKIKQLQNQLKSGNTADRKMSIFEKL